MNNEVSSIFVDLILHVTDGLSRLDVAMSKAMQFQESRFYVLFTYMSRFV